MYLQSTLAAFFLYSLKPFLLWWLNDILNHAQALFDLFEVISRFFDFCPTYSWKLQPSKCTVLPHSSAGVGTSFRLMAYYLTLVVSTESVKIVAPQTGADLQQLCAPCNGHTHEFLRSQLSSVLFLTSSKRFTPPVVSALNLLLDVSLYMILAGLRRMRMPFNDTNTCWLIRSS